MIPTPPGLLPSRPSRPGGPPSRHRPTQHQGACSNHPGGARMGFRLVSYVAGPIAALVLIPGLAISAFFLGAGRGFGVSRLVTGALAFYLIFAIYGGVFGAAFGLVGALLRRGKPGSFLTRVGRVFSRPIALFPGKKGREASESGPRARFFGKYWPWLIGVPEVLALAGGFGCGAYVGRLVDRRLPKPSPPRIATTQVGGSKTSWPTVLPCPIRRTRPWSWKKRLPLCPQTGPRIPPLTLASRSRQRLAPSRRSIGSTQRPIT